MLTEKMTVVDFKVPLSGSVLFDINARSMAEKLCAKFPGLDYTSEEKHIHIHGELNEFWAAKFNDAVFKLGTLD